MVGEVDIRAHLGRMREVQSAQLQALESDDDLRLDALLDEMATLALELPDDALLDVGDPEILDLARSVQIAQEELIALAEARRSHARQALQGLDHGRSALAAYAPSTPVSITDRSA